MLTTKISKIFIIHYKPLLNRKKYLLNYFNNNGIENFEFRDLYQREYLTKKLTNEYFKLDNLCLIIDYNKLQSDNFNSVIMGLEPLRAKWESFNWNVIEINGHASTEVNNALKDAKEFKGKPTVIIANTIKGKGVSYMENSPLWHGSVMLTKKDMLQAFHDLEATENELLEFKD